MSKENDENWVIAENDELFTRFNNLPAIENFKVTYPFRMGIAIPIKVDAEVNNYLLQVESWIEKVLDTQGVFVASFLGKIDNFKEFVFYVEEDLNYEKIHNELKLKFPKLEIQMYVNKDPDWDFFLELKNNLNGNK